jgi:hypothetical protein
MNPMAWTHTAECQAAMQKRVAEIAAWQDRWPNHCRTCRGAGASYSSYDPSPSGVLLGSGSMIDVDLCPDCAELGACSRCGWSTYLLEQGEHGTDGCRRCGWDGQDCQPPDPECICPIPDDLF